MIDLHTHILPGIDDGAENETTSLRMLLMQQREGVDRLFLTPHFDCRKGSVEEFLRRREDAFDRLRRAAAGSATPEMKLGAEVRFSPELMREDLSRLTLGGSDYLLLELSPRRYPAVLEEAVEEMLDRGYIPILAHVERFFYFCGHPDLLAGLIEQGALAQVSADVVIDRKRFSGSHACIKHDLAQFVASDAHNTDVRPPNLGRAAAKLPDVFRRRMNAFLNAVWEGRDVPSAPDPSTPNPFFCRRP